MWHVRAKGDPLAVTPGEGLLAAGLASCRVAAATEEGASEEAKIVPAGPRQWALRISHEYLQPMVATASIVRGTCCGGTPKSSSACALAMPMTPK